MADEEQGKTAIELLKSAMEHLRKVNPRVVRTRSGEASTNSLRADTKIPREHAEGIKRMQYQRERIELAVMDLQSTARDNIGPNWRRNQILKDSEKK